MARKLKAAVKPSSRGPRGPRGERGANGLPGVTPGELIDLQKSVERLRTDSEIQLQRIAQIQAQLDLVLSRLKEVFTSRRGTDRPAVRQTRRASDGL